jgi:DNA-binding transcriptional LysR family regulator
MSEYDRLEFKHLEAIVAIADAGTFTAAAANMRLAQSALSRRIGEIEDVFKIQIFERDRTGATLTPAGETLLQYARATLQSRIEIVDVVQAIQHASLRPFRLGFTPFIDPYVIEAVAESYQVLFPHGSIQPENVEMSDVVDRLKESELDAALVTLPLIPDGHRIQKIMKKRLVVCIRKDDPLAEKERLDPQSLSGRLAIFSDPRHHPIAHARLLEMLKEKGINPKVAKPTFNGEQVQYMVRRRLGVALVRQDEPLHEDLTTRPIDGVDWTIDSALVYRTDRDQLALPLLLRDLAKRFSVKDESAQRKPPHRAVSGKELQQELFSNAKSYSSD